MFRDEISPMANENFGVGSVVQAGHQSWLVVGHMDTGSVSLLSLDSMICGSKHTVADLNHLSKREVMLLVNGLSNFTFSDFSFDPKGFKRL